MKEQIQIQFPDGKKAYEGDMVSGSLNGEGQLWYIRTETLHYQGQWEDNRPHGLGKAYHPNGNLWYEGEWKEGKREGEGKQYNEGGNFLYEGQWKANRFHGLGKLYDPDGHLIYDGSFSAGREDGEGRQYRPEGGLSYQGQWKEGNPHGQGIKYHENGLIWYDGSFEGGQSHGCGKAYYEEGGLAYQGNWKDGLRHGEGKLYNADGHLEYFGQWNQGEPVAQFIEEEGEREEMSSVHNLPLESLRQRLPEFEVTDQREVIIDLGQCLAFHFTPLSPLEIDWNPFAATLRQFEENPDLTYDQSILKSYYDAYPRENKQQAFMLPTTNPYPPLWDLKARAAFPMPWTRPEQYARFYLGAGFIQYEGKAPAFSEKNISEIERMVYDFSRSQPLSQWVPEDKPSLGNPIPRPGLAEFGPVEQEEGEAIFKKLLDTYICIRTIGYLPALFKGSVVSGTLLLQEGDYRFVVGSGMFLVAALAACGYKTISAVLSQDTFGVVSFSDISQLPYVKRDVYPLDTAQTLFLQAFSPFRDKGKDISIEEGGTDEQ